MAAELLTEDEVDGIVPTQEGEAMRGIILAGGTGSRLFPITQAISKQLMPIYDKPMIYYPLATLIDAAIREVLIITGPEHRWQFEHLLGDGSQLGMRISYATQDSPDGLAQAFIIGEQFIEDRSVALILGDNIFHGAELGRSLRRHADVEGATIFAYRVRNPSDYGVVEFDDAFRAIGIEEKPIAPRSNYAIPGLYFYDSSVVEYAHSITPSTRGELEVSDLNARYLAEGRLSVGVLNPGVAWLDTGRFDSMMAASEYVRVIESRQGIKIGCIEEAAWRNGWIGDSDLAALAEPLRKSGYGEYLLSLSQG